MPVIKEEAIVWERANTLAFLERGFQVHTAAYCFIIKAKDTRVLFTPRQPDGVVLAVFTSCTNLSEYVCSKFRQFIL